MKIQELAINEYGNAPNNSSNPGVAGGVPSAVANLKARRQAMAANQANAAAQTQPTTTSNTQTGSTTTTTTPGSTRPVEKRGLLYRMGKGIVGAAGALGSTKAQQATRRIADLEKEQDFGAGPQTTTTAGNAAPATDTTSSQAQEPKEQPGADPIHAILKDPNALKAEWDTFVASKPNYKLIADPQLLSVLKNMWMRSGGVRAESKKNKGKPV